jgi:hypothetical protein
MCKRGKKGKEAKMPDYHAVDKSLKFLIKPRTEPAILHLAIKGKVAQEDFAPSLINLPKDTPPQNNHSSALVVKTDDIQFYDVVYHSDG